MSRVLMTGFNGFCGQYLNQELKNRNIDTIGITRYPSSNKTQTFAADICNAHQITHIIERVRPTHVVHLAGISSPDHGDHLDFFKINTLGTLTFLDCLVKTASKLEKVILISSANVYGTPDREILSEDICPQPINTYGASKLAMEHLAKNYWDKLPIQIVRPFNFTGRGQTDKFLVPKIVNHFRANARSIELGNINISRDFSDVRDVARFLADILLNNSSRETVNLCSGKFTNLSRIIQYCESLTGRTIDIKVNPDYIRENEILRLRGCTSHLDTLISKTDRIPFKETLDWMLSAAPEQ